MHNLQHNLLVMLQQQRGVHFTAVDLKVGKGLIITLQTLNNFSLNHRNATTRVDRVPRKMP